MASHESDAGTVKSCVIHEHTKSICQPVYLTVSLLAFIFSSQGSTHISLIHRTNTEYIILVHVTLGFDEQLVDSCFSQ